MQISPHRTAYKFKGIAEVGKEPPQAKQALDKGTIESHTFPFDGKQYRAWDEEKDTVLLAYNKYGDETLVHYPGTTMVHEEFGIQHHGSGFETTKDPAVLAKAAATLKETLGKLVAPLLQPKAKAEAKETKTQEV